jgi:hypothetical protein
MKAWLVTLPLLCAAGFAMAADTVASPAVGATDSAMMEAPAPKKVYRHKVKRLPRGDLRHCLELKTNEEIIACTEKRRKR